MSTFTPDKVSLDATIAKAPAVERDTKLHTGPVARLLAQVSKWSGDYTDYQMEEGVWRKLAL